MALELQVRQTVLATLVGRVVQQSLMAACVPATGDHFVDHANALPGRARWTISDDGKTLLLLPVEVFVVERAELLAAVGQVPAGATTSRGSVELKIWVRIEGTVIVVAVDDVDLDPAAGLLGPAAEDVKRAIKDAAGRGLRIDLGPVLGSLGIDVSSGGAVDLVGDLLVAPFGGDPSRPPARVGHEFEWGIFLDGRSLEDLMRERIPESIPPLQGLRPHVQWSPPGPVPTLATRIEGSFDVPDPFTCRVEVSVRSGLSMPTPTSLRIDSRWDLDVDTGFVPPEVTAAIGIATELLKSALVRPATFGAEATGGQSFAMTLPLPEFRVAGQRWPYDGMVIDPAGVVLGGSVGLPVDVSHIVLKASASGFSGSPVKFLFCSSGASPVDRPFAHLFSTIATVQYEGGGALCDVTVLPLGRGLEAHLTMPKALPMTNGLRPADGTIFMAFAAEDANAINEQVQLIVRTARGVRAFKLGRPEHFDITPDGLIEGGEVFWLDDCNALPPNFGEMTPEDYDRWTGIIWYTYWGLKPGEYDPDNPPIMPATLADIPAHWEDVVIPDATVDLETVVIVPDAFRGSRGASDMEIVGREMATGPETATDDVAPAQAEIPFEDTGR